MYKVRYSFTCFDAYVHSATKSAEPNFLKWNQYEFYLPVVWETVVVGGNVVLSGIVEKWAISWKNF